MDRCNNQIFVAATNGMSFNEVNEWELQQMRRSSELTEMLAGCPIFWTADFDSFVELNLFHSVGRNLAYARNLSRMGERCCSLFLVFTGLSC